MPTVLFEIKNNIGFIYLNRPEKLNSFNPEMSMLLHDILDECNESDKVRCVYLTGCGKGFCAGQDLAEVVDPSGAAIHKILVEQFNPIIQKIRMLEKPVLAAVNGVAAGAGANIALCCDIVVASTAAYFVQAFSKVGLIPDCGGTYFLPRLIGFQKASAVMMLAEKINAKTAKGFGMVYKVFHKDNFAHESKKIALKLAQMPTHGLWFTKKALNESLTNSIEHQLRLEDELQQKAAATKDFREGVDAFLQKRRPVFSGK